jgi:NADPH-dependent curcumin reductase CurA
MATYKSVVLAARPKTEITPGTFKTIEKPVLTEADLKDGQILLKTRYLSLDPAMRGWLRGESWCLFQAFLGSNGTILILRNWWRFP